MLAEQLSSFITGLTWITKHDKCYWGQFQEKNRNLFIDDFLKGYGKKVVLSSTFILSRLDGCVLLVARKGKTSLQYDLAFQIRSDVPVLSYSFETMQDRINRLAGEAKRNIDAQIDLPAGLYAFMNNVLGEDIPEFTVEQLEGLEDIE